MVVLGDWLAAQPFSLAMSSGFFSFYAHTGMLDSITARGLLPQLVAGSSAGALVGACWAAGLEMTALAEILGAMQRRDFWDPAAGAGLLAGKKFDRMLRDMLPIAQVERGRVPVKISVFEIASRTTRVISSGDLPPAIRASCAVPGLFHPVWIDRRAYWDGGILDRPGLAGVPPGERVLFHHIASRSPWRRRELAPPRRPNMVTLVIDELPRSGPFKLAEGRRALELARIATERALEQPIVDDLVRISVREGRQAARPPGR